MRLSEHFTLEELTVSSKADSLGIDNDPEPAHLDNMKRHLAPGLELIRQALGDRSVTVTSAYRNPQVNALVGGTPTSAHPMGLAADIRVSGLSSLKTSQLIAAEMKAGRIRIDQMIWESGRSVTHVSFDPRRRGQMGHQPGGPLTPINFHFFD